MGKFSVEAFKYLTKDDFRILTAVEMGMKNHEYVPGSLVQRISNLGSKGIHKMLRTLCDKRLICYERGKSFEGYRLNNLGYDYLALKVLASREHINAVGRQIGVGKESDIYLVSDSSNETLCMKLHRLGRTSFRKLREKRDYHGRRNKTSWIYLSRLSAAKEFAFMQALYAHGFPVPKPVAHNRHTLIMSLVNGFPLNQISEVGDVEGMYSELMELIVRLAEHGVIHSDFNEFNIMVDEESAKPVLIDFPQMISISHQNAQWYFNRDVTCVRDFFKRRFGFESEEYPKFEEDVRREFKLDQEVMASGYSKDIKVFDSEYAVGEKIEEENEDDIEECEEVEDDNEEEEDLEFDEREEFEEKSDEDENFNAESDEREDINGDSTNSENSEVCDASEVLNLQEEMEKLGLKDLETESKPVKELTKREMRKAFKMKDSDTMSCKSFRSVRSDADTKMLKDVLLGYRKVAIAAKEKGEKEPSIAETLKSIQFEDGSHFNIKTSFTEDDVETAKRKVAHQRQKKERNKDERAISVRSTRVTVKRKRKETRQDTKDCSVWDY